MKSNKSAQGTMEYLIIIAIVILISLFVVTLALNQTDNAQKINDSSDKITNTVGKGGISIVDSVTSSNGDSVISLKNTSGKTLTIKSITPIDAQGNEGTSNNYDEELITGYTSEFLAENMDEICPCVENEKTTCVIKIVFDVEEGLAGHEETFTVTNTCTSEISYYTVNYLAETGGEIIGDTNQKILSGKDGTTVTAQAQEGYTFSQWSDGSTTTTRTDTSVNTDLEIIAEFEEIIEEEPPSIEFVESCWSDTIEPHPICNCFDLNQIRGSKIIPGSGGEGSEDITINYNEWNYSLQYDIDMKSEECSIFQNENGFEPINFNGNFDGNEHKITNLFINKPENTSVGLFGEVNSKGTGSYIINLQLEDVNIIGKTFVGGLIGLCSMMQIENSHVTGEVLSNEGIVGGLIGSSYLSTTSKSSFIGTVTGNGNVVGGLIGDNVGDGELTSGPGSIIEESFSKGIVKSNGNLVGGLVARNDLYSIINNSYSTSEINGWKQVAGLAAYNGTDSIISNSFSIGKINGASNECEHDYVCGFIGENGSGIEITNSFYNTETSDRSDIGKGEPKTTIQMTHPYNSEDTFSAWDFVNVWAHDTTGIINDGYPYLSWQVHTTGVGGDPEPE